MLVDWPDELPALNELREYLRLLTRLMAEGMVKDLPIAVDEPWQVLGELPSIVQESARKKSIEISVGCCCSLRFVIKLVGTNSASLFLIKMLWITFWSSVRRISPVP